jgi:anti-sigma regulatory factor (Ser/Thr protein kinase)
VFEKVALVGATGAVGRIMLQLLTERSFPAKQYKFLASARSAGKSIAFQGKSYTIDELTPTAFAGCDLVIASTPDDVAAKYLPYAVEAGCTVIDESGYWRMKPEVALVIPEVNPEAALSAKGIIASPNCSTTQMVVALKPLHDAARLKRVIVSSYQAVSGVGLQGTVELLEGRTDLPDTTSRPLERLRSQSQRMATAIAQVAAFTQAPVGERIDVDLSALTRIAVDLRRFAATRAGLTIELSADGACLVHGNGAELQQAILNLLANALDASPSPGQVSLTLRTAGERADIAVTDQGRGIPETDWEKLFSPFFSTKERGTGLGLTFARKIVELHGGTLIAHNNLNGGATFLIELPARVPEE